MSLKIEKIGIALAAYRPDPVFFLEQLESIQKQSYTNWICVIGFDSDPKTYISDLNFQNIWKDNRFKIKINLNKLGPKLNFQNTIGALTELNVDAFACSDQDDIWLPEKLEVCRTKLSECGPNSLVHSDMKIMISEQHRWVDHNLTAWALEKRGIHNNTPEDYLIRNTVAGAAMLVDISLAKKFPVIPNAFPFHDHWYAFVASCYGGTHPIYLPLYRYRQHGHNVLGIRSFDGIISLNDKPWKILPLIRNLKAKYLWSQALARSSLESGLIPNEANRFLNQSFFSYLRQSVKHISDDPALSRALLARGLGQVLSHIS